MSHTPSPWTLDDPIHAGVVEERYHCIDSSEFWVSGFLSIDDARLITAAPDLLEAAKLTVLHFQRSQASGNFQGDDEHEAWTALQKAIAKAEGAPVDREEPKP